MLKSNGFVSFRTLLSLAWSERKKYIPAVVLMGVSALATAVYAFLVGPTLRALFGARNTLVEDSPGHSWLTAVSTEISSSGPFVLALVIAVAAAVKGLAFFGHQALAGSAGQSLLDRLRLRLYSGLLASNPFSQPSLSSGDLVARFTVDAEAVESAVSNGAIAVMRDMLQILALGALAVALDPLLGIVGLVAFPPTALFIVRLGRRVRARRAAVHDAFGALGNAVDETASGLAVAQSFGAEELLAARFERASRTVRHHSARALALRALSSPVNEMLGAAALGLTLWYAQARIAEGALSAEHFISFFSALLLLYQPVKGLGAAQHAMQAGLAALGRLSSLWQSAGLGLTASVAEAEGTLSPSETQLQDAETGYGDGASVLKRVNLTIRRGEHVAVIGPSGAGKSTLLNLLLGFLPLRSGKMTIDGSVCALTAQTARRLFAPVPQEPFLFDDTIRVNVLCGRPEAKDGEVERACDAAGVASFARRLPLGLDSQVGLRGKNLSLGERQRVCLARALLSGAPVLLLDEPTASLDSETEQLIASGFEEALGDRTAVIVTHRLATASWARAIVVLDAGETRFAGAADALACDPRVVALLSGATTRTVAELDRS